MLGEKSTKPFGKRMITLLWVFICVITFGFPAKYRERLRLFETLIPPPDIPWSTVPVFSDRGPSNSNDPQKTMRQKQQEEWDRLNITMSVITATSAAALAIEAASGQSKVYWLVTAFYSIAFGLSLQGLILITYMTVTAGGSSDEAIWRLATGTLLSDNPKFQVVKPTAFIMALPTILATYSSVALLAGLATMVVSGSWDGVDTRRRQYILVTLIPVGAAFVCLCAALAVCELGAWIEIWGRKKYLRDRGLSEYPAQNLRKASLSSDTSTMVSTSEECLLNGGFRGHYH